MARPEFPAHQIQCPVCGEPVRLKLARPAFMRFVERAESEDELLDVLALMARSYCPGRWVPGHIGAKEAHA